MFLAGLVIMLLGALGACSSTPAPEAGRVVALRYDPPRDWSSTICTSYGKYGCNFYMPIEHHDGPSWRLLIEATRDDEGKVRRGWRSVDAAEYAACHVGNDYNPSDGCRTSGGA